MALRAEQDIFLPVVDDPDRFLSFEGGEGGVEGKEDRRLNLAAESPSDRWANHPKLVGAPSQDYRGHSRNRIRDLHGTVNHYARAFRNSHGA
ncbi:MAG: hypothetical protein CSYNP_04423 [Syntrophus sp. SKADARSKE-3]|nr:hypothetical protein [Syntrophus sp. SKADARSKE-3]